MKRLRVGEGDRHEAAAIGGRSHRRKASAERGGVYTCHDNSRTERSDVSARRGEASCQWSNDRTKWNGIRTQHHDAGSHRNDRVCARRGARSKRSNGRTKWKGTCT
jgi:hypothetical protein